MSKCDICGKTTYRMPQLIGDSSAPTYNHLAVDQYRCDDVIRQFNSALIGQPAAPGSGEGAARE